MPGIALAALRGDLSPPTEWETVGKLENLYIFPGKSLAHVSVPEMQMGDTGGSFGALKDRQFMVTDHKGKFVSSRRYPQMALIQPAVTEKTITLTYPGKGEKVVPLDKEGDLRDCEIWGETCSGREIGQDQQMSSWLSEILAGHPDGGFRLMYHAAEASSRPGRSEEDKHCTPLMLAKDKPLYADGCPFMMFSKQSVNALNQKLKEEGETLEVEETRFRPNLVVSGDFPGFAEDSWSFIKIGDVVLRNIKPCTRCVFVTVDPFKGEKDKKGQPLKLLRQYRSSEDPVEKKKYGTSPLFGINLGLEVGGTVKIGQDVQIRKSEVTK